MSKPIISVSGLRGIVGETLDPESAIRFTCAFATQLGEGPIVITRDGRVSGRMLADATRAGLCAAGRDVLDADVAATPTTGVLVRQVAAAGGIQISASHNPAPYNGIKLFGAEGRVLSADRGERVLAAFQSAAPRWVPADEVGQLTIVDDPHAAHLDAVLEIVDVAAIRRRNFRVLVDSTHGAGSLLAQRLLTALGCQIELVGGRPDGKFEHPPEPTAKNLAGVCQRVAEAGAAVGFCQDPDADRLALIDERGQYVGEEYTLAICLEHVLKQVRGPVVTNCATSRMSRDIAERAGVPFFQTPVGEANVADVMIREQAAFGGEGNGGPIDPRIGYVRDSFVGMALVLDCLAAEDASVSQIVDRLPRYAIHKTTVPLRQEQVADGLELLQRHFSDASADRADGLRLDWPDRWLLIRASNTEPIVRTIAEAATAELAQSLCEDAAQVLQS